MIKRIKIWFSNYREKRRRKQILEIIKEAKQAYLDHEDPFMCICFEKVYPFYCYNDIVRKIPEFKPSTFGIPETKQHDVWWPCKDRQSRINAFDKLIEIYSK